jgi:glycyl-tRNA synthetase beta chain
VQAAARRDDYGEAMRQLAALSAPVDRFFVDVLVMADDQSVRQARLALLTALRTMVLNIADISELAAEEKPA